MGHTPTTVRFGRRAAIALLGAAALLIGVAPPAQAAGQPDAAAGPRPLFQLPFACGQQWDASTRGDHKPNQYSLDLMKAGGGSNGQPILAAYGGQVVKSGYDDGGGWHVRIDHGNGWQTRYLHMIEAPMVAAGQQVSIGQQLGRVGSTGDSGAPHLHFEQMQDGTTVRSWFNGAPVTVEIGRSQRLTSNNCGSQTGGGAHHLVRHPDGSWTPFVSLSLDGVSQVAVSADPSAQAHALAVRNGEVWHRLRYADGSWTAWGMVGNPGATAISASTDDGGNLHVAIAAGGQAQHLIRMAGDGSWTQWGGLGSPAGAVTAVSIAVDTTRSVAHLSVTTADGQIAHRVRNTDGSWTEWGGLGNPGATAISSATDGDGNLHLGFAAGASAYHLVRWAADGSWTQWGGLGGPGSTVTSVSVAVDTGRGIAHLSIVAGGQILHRVRNADGSWTDWGYVGNPGNGVSVASSADPAGTLHMLSAL